MKKLIISAILMTLFIAACDVLRRGWWDTQEETAKLFTTKTMADAFAAFHDDLSRYPTTREGLGVLLHAPSGDEARRWKGPYFEGGIPIDPWRHEYRYLFPGMMNRSSYDFWSLGPDGILSNDDIGNWTN